MDDRIPETDCGYGEFIFGTGPRFILVFRGSQSIGLLFWRHCGVIEIWRYRNRPTFNEKAKGKLIFVSKKKIRYVNENTHNVTIAVFNVQDNLFEKVYGTTSIGHRQSNALIIENPSLENLPQEPSKLVVENSSNSEKKEKQHTPSKTSLPTTNKQIETRTSDGRRRITPIFVAPAPDIGYICLFNCTKLTSSFTDFIIFLCSTEKIQLHSKLLQLQLYRFQVLAKKKVVLSSKNETMWLSSLMSLTATPLETWLKLKMRMW